jgi:hypothetical protein
MRVSIQAALSREMSIVINLDFTPAPPYCGCTTPQVHGFEFHIPRAVDLP